MSYDRTAVANRPIDEALEPRQLLSVNPEGWMLVAAEEEGAVTWLERGPLYAIADLSRQPEADDVEAVPAPAAPAPSSVRAAAVAAAVVDAAAVRDELIRFVDIWNGGQYGRLGTSGMGTYAATWDGLFRMNLDRAFSRVINTYTDDMSIIAQSRAIYINVEAYRNAPAADQSRFRTAVQRGADYLLSKAVDPNTYNGKRGGMWWGLQPDGVSPPTHTTPIGGTAPRAKNAYGQVQSLFALAHAYSVTGDADHLNGAFAQLDVWNTQFADTAGGPGAFLQTANEDYTQRIGTRNVDYMTHAFEAMLTLNDITPASDTRKAGLATQITNIGNFISTRMYRDAPGSTTMGYLPWYYDAQWNPPADQNQQFSTPGHNMEVAFLLSRAVERGFNPAWLGVADKLVAYTLRYSFDNVPASPTYGAVPHEELKFDGTRFDPTPNNLVWWQQSEATRTLLHFAAVRGRSDLWDEYNAASAFIRARFIDPVYGGWYQYLKPDTLTPTTTDKGTVWTGGYHEAMLDAERIRVGTDATAGAVFPAAADAYVRDGTYAGQNFGGATDLVVKRSATSGNTRETYLRFGLTGLGDVVSGKLRVFGRSSTSEQGAGVALYPVASTTWSESGLTWDTKPAAASTTPLATTTISGMVGGWYEFDVTAYLQQQEAAGATAIGFVLKATGVTDAQALFTSDENAAGRPELVVRHTTAQQPQSLVVSASSLTVPEGGSASFTVKLAAQPTADVTVTVARQSGDADLTGGGTLVFTPSNWGAPQTVTIAAAPDADATHGLAVFAVAAAGLETKLVTASESDDEVVTPISLRAAADAYVRDGTYAGQNFGGAVDLVVKRSANAGNTRETYLRFDLGEVSAVESVKLRLFGQSSSSTQGVGVALYGTSNVTWSETGLTWNTKPAAGASALGTKPVSGTVRAWYEFDVTAHVQQQLALGATAVAFAVKATTTTDAQALFTSDEATTNRPQLVVTPATAVPQSLVVSKTTLSVPEGGTGQFTVKLAAKPAADLTVRVERQSGDHNLSGGGALVFTPADWATSQTVTIAAAADADTADGSAVFAVTASGLDTKTVTVTEADRSVVPVILTLPATADAHVRDGADAGTNFGNAGVLEVRTDGAGGGSELHLKFSLAGVGTVGNATLRLYGWLQDVPEYVVEVSAYATNAGSWTEGGVTWNNRPSAASGVLATTTVPDTRAYWCDWDLTAFVREQLAQGRGEVSLVLRAVRPDVAALFRSAEGGGTNGPLLVVTPDEEVPQALLVSDTRLNVPEGGTSQITVRLAKPPPAEQTVSIYRESGDEDVTADGGHTFTSDDWHIPQTVSFTAAQDADTSGGTAVFTMYSPGLEPVTITVTEVDDDVPAGPVVVRAGADAYVRDGTYAGQNFGGAPELIVKRSANLGNTREAYLRFDLAGVSAVGTAKLRLSGRSSTSTQSVGVSLYAASNVTWSETGLTWSNKPASGSSALGSNPIAGTANAWYEFDVTQYVRQQKASGAAAVTFVLKAGGITDAQALFVSDEAAANRPELVVFPVVAVPPAVVVSTPTLAVPEGSVAVLDVRLAAQPAADVTVSVTKQPGGDLDLSASKTSLTFTPVNWAVAQSVNVSAGEDADAASGSAVYTLAAPGGEPVEVVVTEVENDAPVTNVTLRATADAYVRGGTYATANFGSATDLVVKHALSIDYVRETYISFDVSAVSDVSTAKLRLFGRLTSSVNPTLTTWVHPVSGATWTEAGINWNNRPAMDATSLGTIVVAGTAGKWYELDVTSFVQAEKAAGRNRVTLGLRNHEPSDAQTAFVSDEATANRPELVVALSSSATQDVDTRLMAAVGVADRQLRQTLADLGTDAAKYVQVTGSDGKWNVVTASAWTSGMLPGSLWYMAKMTGDAYWITEAVRRTLPLDGQKTQKDDLAFRLGYAYWPLYAHTGNAMYRQVLIDAAASKVSMYNGVVGAFRSPFRASTSGNPAADFGVLMDQITDVELVLWTAQQTNNAEWTDKAIRHLQTLASHVVRPDGSTYQWTYFNSQTGQFIGGEAYQGYSATSTWSRGQAWAIHGFTTGYRQTGRAEFLEAAKRVSDWYLAHLPAGDMVPYWDFAAPGIPNTYKDSSAAAVAAAGLAQLATLTPDTVDAARYLKAAGDTLFQLSSPAYLSDGTTSRGILLHGAWFVPPPMQVGDSSTIWGDYFFLEAISRYMNAKYNP